MEDTSKLHFWTWKMSNSFHPIHPNPSSIHPQHIYAILMNIEAVEEPWNLCVSSQCPPNLQGVPLPCQSGSDLSALQFLDWWPGSAYVLGVTWKLVTLYDIYDIIWHIVEHDKILQYFTYVYTSTFAIVYIWYHHVNIIGSNRLIRWSSQI